MTSDVLLIALEGEQPPKPATLVDPFGVLALDPCAPCGFLFYTDLVVGGAEIPALEEVDQRGRGVEDLGLSQPQNQGGI